MYGHDTNITFFFFFETNITFKLHYIFFFETNITFKLQGCPFFS